MSFEEVFSNLNKKLEGCDIMLISNQFKSILTDVERVEFVINLDASLKFITFNVESSCAAGKNVVKSTELRSVGNKYFQKGCMMEALSKYTESLCYAPTEIDDSRCLPLAYANRSAVLCRLKRYAEALADIELAIENHYPQNLMPKLLVRKGDCLKEINKLFLDDRDSKIIPTHQKGSNSNYHSLSSSCEVAYDKTKGRHIVASKDIRPGEIILIEKPFASVLVPQRFLTHCHQCLSYVNNPLPCISCVHSVYCSNQCRINANQSLHKYECPIMSFLDISNNKFSRLVVRTILSVPASDILRHFNKQNCEPTESLACYSWNDYRNICGLLTNDSKRPVNDLFRRSVMAVYLLRVVEMTSYFQEADSFLVKSHVAALMLSHLQSFPCNAHEISEFLLDESSVLASMPRELGSGIYATLSLFNHSCNPVVTRNFYKDICVVRSISTIKKGSEITDNYGVLFQLHSKEERNKHLNPQYFFECMCSACLENWPTFTESLGKSPQWKCNECYFPLNSCSTVSMLFCNNCKQSKDLSTKKFCIIESEKMFKRAYDLLLSNKPQEAASGICNYLEILNNEVCEPWNEFARGQESLKQCYSMMANCLNFKEDSGIS